MAMKMLLGWTFASDKEFTPVSDDLTHALRAPSQGATGEKDVSPTASPKKAQDRKKNLV
jgi:hypothetical protein